MESIGGKIYFSRLRDLIRLDVGEAGLSVEAVVPAGRIIRQLKADKRYISISTFCRTRRRSSELTDGK